MKNRIVAVIFGGYSPEYDVSLNSSYSIINAIDKGKYEVVLLGITRLGEWYRYTGDVDDIPSDKWHTDGLNLTKVIFSPSRGEGLMEFVNGNWTLLPIDVAFPVLHGKFGEDGTVQGMFELAGIPVVGAGSAASALCMDKDRAHKLVSLAGISIPKAISFEYYPTDAELFSKVADMKLPLFVKPVKAGSSFGITKVESISELPEAVRFAYKFDNTIIIEENVDGFEAGCAVVGNYDLKTGRIDEIELSHGFFNYEEKYTLKTSKIHMPARIDEETEQRLQAAAKTIYHALGCYGYARIDMFLTPDNEIIFNEANTIPGFTSHSRFPNMMNGVGVDYPELVDMLIKLSFEREY